MPLNFDPVQPFALLWDGVADHARLFSGPLGFVATTDYAAGLCALRAAGAAGEWLAGGLSFEAGYASEPRLAGRARGEPWLWFGRFPAPRLLDEAGVADLLAAFRGPVSLGALKPLVAREDWIGAVGEAQRLIAAGDIYQANLTFPAELPLRGHPLAVFERLFSSQAAPHGALVHMGDGRWWLSLSPELFFRLEAGTLLARPMKGTAPRLPAAGADADAARALGADPKNRAENLMITDLIRNDLARVARAGSVRVPHLFEVETYPSVHQMTSTVTAELDEGADAIDVLGALFPCGSITGAPKLRAMEIIAALEEAPRGLYCGSIGWIGPGGAAAGFNVAIRTLEVEKGRARLGLGSGIVADSVPAAEWEECLTKARFLGASGPATLIETMRLGADGLIARLPLHLDRMAASAARFGFRLERAAVEARLAGLAGPERRVRLLLDRAGGIAVQLSPLGPVRDTPMRVAVGPLPVAADDWRLHHKTGDRGFYDAARQACGADEILFERADGLLTEGSFTNVFVPRDGALLTPPAALGLLPGVLRAELLRTGEAVAAELRRADLARGFFVGNSLRGLVPATLAG